MTLTATERERKWEIWLEIMVNTYPEEPVAVHILSDMWNHLLQMWYEVNRILAQVVKDYLKSKYVS